MSLEAVFLLILITMLGTCMAAFFIFKGYFEKRAEARVSDQLSLVLDAETLLAQQRENDVILSKIIVATNTMADAVARAQTLSGIYDSAKIKNALAGLEKEVAALKKEYATKVEKLAGATMYPEPVATANNNSGNKGQTGQPSASNKITEAVKAAGQSLGRKVEFNEVWSIVKDMEPSVKRVEDFQKLDSAKQDGLLSAAQIRLANANSNGTGA